MKISTTIKKANIFLKNDESLYDFESAISIAANKELDISSDDYVWTSEVTSTHIVVTVSSDTSYDSFKMNYTRNVEGEFSFTEPVPVKAVTTYVEI